MSWTRAPEAYMKVVCHSAKPICSLLFIDSVWTLADGNDRYTDFLVNEIAPDGTVVHLTDDKVPKFKDVKKASLYVHHFTA